MQVIFSSLDYTGESWRIPTHEFVEKIQKDSAVAALISESMNQISFEPLFCVISMAEMYGVGPRVRGIKSGKRIF
jgi:hypothetical protein